MNSIPSSVTSSNYQSRYWFNGSESSEITDSISINAVSLLSNILLSRFMISLKSLGKIILLLKEKLILLSFVKLFLLTLISCTLKTANMPVLVGGFSFSSTLPKILSGSTSLNVCNYSSEDLISFFSISELLSSSDYVFSPCLVSFTSSSFESKHSLCFSGHSWALSPHIHVSFSSPNSFRSIVQTSTSSPLHSCGSVSH